jgi:hypothetical protein
VLTLRLVQSRPTAERGWQLTELGKLILSQPARPGFSYSTEEGWLESLTLDLPAADAKGTLLACCEQVEKAFTGEPPAHALLQHIARRVPPADQLEAGQAIITRMQAAGDAVFKLAAYAGCLTAMPQALTDEQRLAVVQLLTKSRLIAAPDVAQLAKPLTAEAARSIADNLATGMAEASPARVPDFVQALAGISVELAPQQMQQVAEQYVRYYLEAHPAQASKTQADAGFIKGTMPQGVGLSLIESLAQVTLKRGMPAFAEDARHFLISFVADHIAAEDASEAAQVIEKRISGRQPMGARQNIPVRQDNAQNWLPGAIDRCYSRLPPEAAKDRVDQLTAAIVSETDGQRKLVLQNNLVAALKPLTATEPEQYWNRVEGLLRVLSVDHQYRAISHLAAANPEKLRTLALKHVAAQAGQRLSSQVAQLARLASASLPLQERLDFADRLVAQGQLSPGACVELASGPSIDGPLAPIGISAAVLAQPDCVGFRRLIVLSAIATPGDGGSLGVWSVFDSAATSSAPGPP